MANRLYGTIVNVIQGKINAHVQILWKKTPLSVIITRASCEDMHLSAGDNIHVVIYDDTIKNPTSVTRDLYNFLGVDPSFIPPSIDKRINSAYETKSKLLKDIIHKCMVAIDRLELENVRMRILESRTLFNIYSTINKRPSQYPKMSVDDRKKCVEIFMDDINSLEKLLNRDFSSWKSVES